MTELPDDPLLDHDGLGLAALVRNGKVMPWDLLDAAMSLEGILNAVIVNCADRARGHAARVDPSTPFAGVPTFRWDPTSLPAPGGTSCSTP